MKELSDSFDVKPTQEDLDELRRIVIERWQAIGGLNKPDAVAELTKLARRGKTFNAVKRHAIKVGLAPFTGSDMRLLRLRLRLTQANMALVLRLGANGGRTIRRWESGDWKPGKQVVLLYEMLADGRLKPDRGD